MEARRGGREGGKRRKGGKEKGEGREGMGEEDRETYE